MRFEKRKHAVRSTTILSVRRGDTAAIGETRNRFFYFHARCGDIVWSGDRPVTFEDELYLLDQGTIELEGAGTHSLGLICDPAPPENLGR